MSRPTVAFFGRPSRINLVYPPALRREVAEYCDLITPDCDGSNWQAHEKRLAKADFILATWGMPVLDGQFLDALPKLKAVFYAAGSIKGFAFGAEAT